MDNTFWFKQTSKEPLFPELLWSRPEHKRTAGKLLIIGGNLHAFAAPAEAYAEAISAGIGTARVLLPDAVKKLIGPVIENGEFSPSTPSGSFNQQSLADFTDHGSWADSVLLAGDLGRNSETAILLEKFLQKTDVPITLTKDAVDYAIHIPATVLGRDKILLVLTMAQLQKLCTAAKLPTAITFSMDLVRLVEVLRAFTEKYSVGIIVKNLSTLLCAYDGNVSTTSTQTPENEAWRIKTASYASVWWLQNSNKPFEALTTAIYVCAGYSEMPR